MYLRPRQHSSTSGSGMNGGTPEARVGMKEAVSSPAGMSLLRSPLTALRQDYPGLFQRLKERVAEDGRFVPVGGCWVEMDCNLVGNIRGSKGCIS